MTTHSLTIIVNALEDAFLTWSFNNFPIMLLMGGLVWFTWWIRGQFTDYRNRFIKVESDCRQLDDRTKQLDERTKQLDETCKRLDKNQQSFNKRLRYFGRRLTTIEQKLDDVIVHLKDRNASRLY